MKPTYLLICLLMGANSDFVFSTELHDVLANPEKYNRRQVELVGIARVPGYFYLFGNVKAAAKTDLSKAILIRQNNFVGKEYREADRQWVRVTGVMSSDLHRGWDSGTGVLLKRVQLLRDRPAPRITDWTVLGIFQNAAAEPVAVDLIPRADGGRTTFFLAPHEADKAIVDEGEAVVSRLAGPVNVRLDLQKIGKPIASRAIRFRNLPPGYQYSPA